MVIVADTGHEHFTCPTKPWQDILDAEWVELFKSVVYLHVSPYMYLVPGQVDILENVHAWRSMFLSTMMTCHSSWAKFMHTLLIFCILIGTSLQNEWHILEVRQRELRGQIRDSWELQDWLFFQLHLHTWFCAKLRSDSHSMFGGLKELMAPRMSLQTCISQITCNINTLTLCKSGKSLTHEE